MEDILKVLPLSGDSRKLIQALSNETSIRILQLLDSGNMSASELAERLKLRLSTLQYHLDALLDTDLIRVADFRWSQKGRKIKVYVRVEKMIVLVPGKGAKGREAALTLLRDCLLLP
ncbi:MAG: helix-turn-helix domain-containing protein [Methanosarcinaceae archaeon]|nr:helix-turn-helix domain-containing protein [Methanosarcinaceae archaeon]